MNLHDWLVLAAPMFILLVPIICRSADAGSPATAPDGPKAQSLRVYVGTYTKGASKGIYCLDFDPAGGTLSAPRVAAEAANPSFLAIGPSRRFLYAVGEVADFGGKKSGAVSSFAIDPGAGKLALLNQQPSGGVGPCFVAVDGGGKNVLVANYSSGSVAVLPIGPDGRLAPPSDVVQHTGKGFHPKYQTGPHAHSINLDAAGRFAFAADLGLDKVFIYRFDPTAGKLAANDPPSVSLAPGAGPRHFAFHPTGRFAYVINELGSTVTAFAYDAGRGALSEVQTLSTVPPGQWTPETNSTAEVAVHPSGKFLYGSNRGHDSIAVFAIDGQTGRLTLVGHEPTQGQTPRNFAIDPSGAWLLAANQDSNSLVLFRIDAASGALKPTGAKVEVPSPVCVKFVPAGIGNSGRSNGSGRNK